MAEKNAKQTAELTKQETELSPSLLPILMAPQFSGLDIPAISFGIAKSIQRLATSRRFRGLNPGGSKRFLSFRSPPDRQWTLPSHLYNGYRVSVPGVERQVPALTIHPHLVTDHSNISTHNLQLRGIFLKTFLEIQTPEWQGLKQVLLITSQPHFNKYPCN